MGLNLSNEQIAQELDLDINDIQIMISQLREGIVTRKPVVTFKGEVDCDEVYVVAGHKGHPEAVKIFGSCGQNGGRPRLARLKNKITKKLGQPNPPALPIRSHERNFFAILHNRGPPIREYDRTSDHRMQRTR